MKAVTDQVYVDDIEAEEEGIAEAVMDNDTIAQVARPGTSLRTPSTAVGGPNQGLRYKRIFTVIIIISNLSNNRSKASSKTIPPRSAI